MNTSTTTQTKAELAQATDAKIADANSRLARAQSKFRCMMDNVHRIVGDHQTRTRWSKSWGMTDEQARAKANDGGPGYYEAELVETEATIQAIQDELDALEKVYTDNGGWDRFFLVPGGHIHSSTACSTCNRNGKPTDFGWLTNLSGLTEAEAVAAHGALLCTVCYPSAPLEWTNALELAAEAKKSAQCPGTGTFLDYSKPHREGYYTGNWGTCPECGDAVTLTKGYRLRTHKPKAN